MERTLTWIQLAVVTDVLGATGFVHVQVFVSAGIDELVSLACIIECDFDW